MQDRVCPPRRMRFSFDSRCRLVSLIVAGMSPQRRPPPAGRAARPVTGSGVATRRAAGQRFASARRCPSTSRGGCRESSSSASSTRATTKAGPLIVASQLGLPASTVWKVLRRYGVSRLRRAAHGPVVRYERERPGELVHVDIKSARLLLDDRQAHLRRPARPLASPAGSTCTWRSTTTHGSPTPNCCPARALTPASPSWAAPSAGIENAASVSSACSATTATATAHTSGQPLAPSSGSHAATPVPDDPRPTARLKRS